jgi:hypothetical protein
LLTKSNVLNDWEVMGREWIRPRRPDARDRLYRVSTTQADILEFVRGD